MSGKRELPMAIKRTTFSNKLGVFCVQYEHDKVKSVSFWNKLQSRNSGLVFDLMRDVISDVKGDKTPGAEEKKGGALETANIQLLLRLYMIWYKGTRLSKYHSLTKRINLIEWEELENFYDISRWWWEALVEKVV